jgi:hypothetical protein
VDLDIVSTAECSGGPNSGDHHESATVTHRYVEAVLAVKENAFERLEAPNTKVRRFRAPDSLMGSCKRQNYAKVAPALKA